MIYLPAFMMSIYSFLALHMLAGLIPLAKADDLTPVKVTARSQSSDYRIFYLTDVTVKVYDFQLLPSQWVFRELDFSYMTAIDSDWNSTRFPFQRFIEPIRTNLTTVSLRYLNLLPGLNVDDFKGLTGLESLSLRNCHITEVHPRTFYAIATAVPGGIHGGVSYQSSLKFLSIYGRFYDPLLRDSLLTFRWETLLPIAESIEMIAIVDHSDLKAITYSPSNAAELMYLNRLRSAVFSLTNLTTLPQSVVDTLNGTTAYDSAPEEPVVTSFVYKANKCRSCELVPLIKWASAPIGSDRKLEISCLKDAYGNYEHYENTSAAWKEYPVSDCQESPFSEREIPRKKNRDVQLPTASRTSKPVSKSTSKSGCSTLSAPERSASERNRDISFTTVARERKRKSHHVAKSDEEVSYANKNSAGYGSRKKISDDETSNSGIPDSDSELDEDDIAELMRIRKKLLRRGKRCPFCFCRQTKEKNPKLLILIRRTKAQHTNSGGKK